MRRSANESPDCCTDAMEVLQRRLPIKQQTKSTRRNLMKLVDCSVVSITIPIKSVDSLVVQITYPTKTTGQSTDFVRFVDRFRILFNRRTPVLNFHIRLCNNRVIRWQIFECKTDEIGCVFYGVVLSTLTAFFLPSVII